MPEITKPGGLSYEVVLEDAKVNLNSHNFYHKKMILEDRAASHQVPGHAHSVRQGHREKAEGLHILIFKRD